MKSIWFSLCKGFLKPVLVAFALAIPVTGWVMQDMHSRMDYDIRLSWWMFAPEASMAVLIALPTASYNAIRAALISPVKNLGQNDSYYELGLMYLKIIYKSTSPLSLIKPVITFPPE